MAKITDWDTYIGHRLKLRDLHVFFAVVQYGSLAKAAARLGVSQPAVSQLIASLEGTLGARLFDRSSRGVAPTAYGRTLLKRSRAAFDELRQGLREIEFLADPAAGELKIGCPESLSAAILPHLVQCFLQKYPRVIVHVDEVRSRSLNESLAPERELDLVLTRIFGALTPAVHSLNVDILFDDQLVVVAGMRSRWARQPKVDLVELIDEPWILSAPGTVNYSHVAEAFQARGLNMPKISLVTHSLHLRSNLVATGPYITAVAHSMMLLNSHRFALKALPVDWPIQSLPVAIVTLKNRTLSPVAERFIECAREVAKTINAPRPAKACRTRRAASGLS